MHGSARPHHEVELLADELMDLKGWGVEPNRLGRMPVLRQLSGVDPSLRLYTAGCIICRWLVAGIEALPDRLYEFDGHRYPVNIMKTAYYLELRIGTEAKHPRRYERLMVLLGLRHSYAAWRKHWERKFLLLLAEHLVEWAHQTT